MLGAFFSPQSQPCKTPSCGLLPYISEERLTKFDDALQQRTRRLCMVLENVCQSRNASAVMRSCDGMGVQDVHLIEDINPGSTTAAYQGNAFLVNSTGTLTPLTQQRHASALRSAGIKSLSPPPVNGYTAHSLPIDPTRGSGDGYGIQGRLRTHVGGRRLPRIHSMLGMAESSTSV